MRVCVRMLQVEPWLNKVAQALSKSVDGDVFKR